MKQAIHKFENTLANLFKDLPHLPESARKTLADLAPWVAGIIGVLGLLSIFSVFGIFTGLALFGGIHFLGIFVQVGLSVVASVLMLMAFKDLQDKKRAGWDKLFLAEIVSLISVVASVLLWSFSVGGFVGALIGFYILFEVKGEFK